MLILTISQVIGCLALAWTLVALSLVKGMQVDDVAVISNAIITVSSLFSSTPPLSHTES